MGGVSKERTRGKGLARPKKANRKSRLFFLEAAAAETTTTPVFPPLIAPSLVSLWFLPPWNYAALAACAPSAAAAVSSLPETLRVKQTDHLRLIDAGEAFGGRTTPEPEGRKPITTLSPERDTVSTQTPTELSLPDTTCGSSAASTSATPPQVITAQAITRRSPRSEPSSVLLPPMVSSADIFKPDEKKQLPRSTIRVDDDSLTEVPIFYPAFLSSSNECRIDSAVSAVTLDGGDADPYAPFPNVETAEGDMLGRSRLRLLPALAPSTNNLLGRSQSVENA